MYQQQSPPQFREIRRLATIKRNDPGKSPEELRMIWTEVNGRPFLSIQWWVRSSSGQWELWKGRSCSIRLKELGDFANAAGDALMEAVRYDAQRTEHYAHTSMKGRDSN